MKLKHILVALVAVWLGLNFAQAATKGQLTLKAGDAAYVCECKCACEIAAAKPGKCGCGKDLIKVTVTKVKGKKAYYQADGKEQSFKLTGKYACGCGADCCQMVSAKPGKCACGKDLAKVGKGK